ncbi:lytic transglycosylase domain-containing protein [Phytohabitans sp. ZYX-F-186]|uniref:Lytic transglycosylase domain-containing protein n=1 Tax=Phytohabitans maris TaxID=3071409 RepID=A0ABU0ZUK2_9ACTN|nr:lytic transglycosylase domain-containing protein [Phytohabitans sp. ZYX-F-186]MDQ7910723.1 lytic transglycosylase domain-containing protein [Phytohabitans sp. ZYX-F-186]
MRRLWSRFGIRALALALLVAGIGGGYHLGQGREAQREGVRAQLVADADQQEVEYLKERHREYTVATAHQREAQRAAAEKAAAAAKTEAERARKAADAAGRRKREEEEAKAEPKPYSGPIPASCNEYSGNRRTGCALLLASGFGIDQMPCLDKLWTKESGWNHKARNPSSGAYGIPQAYPGGKMSSAGTDWETNPATQIKWGLGYIKGRYDDPCGAWAHSEDVGSY